mmetsp:Transcript_52336/g.124942  ORF Transcript_52336/g.124942 Transcript_52336/m.124942 type:complete len:112 (+) Transcript_52336:2653-2988(+)
MFRAAVDFLFFARGRLALVATCKRTAGSEFLLMSCARGVVPVTCRVFRRFNDLRGEAGGDTDPGPGDGEREEEASESRPGKNATVRRLVVDLPLSSGAIAPPSHCHVILRA